MLDLEAHGEQKIQDHHLQSLFTEAYTLADQDYGVSEEHSWHKPPERSKPQFTLLPTGLVFLLTDPTYTGRLLNQNCFLTLFASTDSRLPGSHSPRTKASPPTEDQGKSYHSIST